MESMLLRTPMIAYRPVTSQHPSPLHQPGVLTLILAVILFAEGVAQIVVFAALRTQAGSGWILFDGILTLVLGLSDLA